MSRHNNNRDKLIEQFGYCTCDISSPSAHHDCCINQGCDKVIKTTAEKLGEAQEEIEKLKAETEIEYDWNLYHDMDNRSYHDVNKIKELEKRNEDLEGMVQGMIELNEKNCQIARKNEQEWREHVEWVVKDMKK